MSLRLNLGCGDNRLPAPWQNHDADVDITKPLPWPDNSARFIVIEHCVEHVDYYDAIKFFRECFRILEIGGVLRVTVPSIVQIMNCAEQDYFDWVKAKGWAPTADARGAMHAMLYCHGHKTAWSATQMESALYFCGFPHPQKQDLGWSSHPELRGVEGHAKVIGEKFNAIESMTFECAKMTENLSQNYDKKFFDMHRGWRPEYENIAKILVEHLPAFADVTDFGCGNGYIIDALAEKYGKDVIGYDGSESTGRPDTIIADLTKNFEYIEENDLVICTEVAEHVAEWHADALVNNLCRAARETIFFSAAKAGHGGHLHINEQPHEYWVQKFFQRGFALDTVLTERIAAALRTENKRTWWFAENCFVLRRRRARNEDMRAMSMQTEFKWTAPKKIAIVVGGGERVWGDVDAARKLCVAANLTPTWFAANDMIQLFPDPMIAVTLHPDKLSAWLTQRANAKLPMPTQVWSHNGGSRPTNPHVTHRLKDWGGSAGLFGITVARNLQFEHILLCGVPMTSDNHFVRKTKWDAVSAFVKKWEPRKVELAPYVRSLSGGMTEKMFGIPDANWLSNNNSAVENVA